MTVKASSRNQGITSNLVGAATVVLGSTTWRPKPFVSKAQLPRTQNHAFISEGGGRIRDVTRIPQAQSFAQQPSLSLVSRRNETVRPPPPLKNESLLQQRTVPIATFPSLLPQSSILKRQSISTAADLSSGEKGDARTGYLSTAESEKKTILRCPTFTLTMT